MAEYVVGQKRVLVVGNSVFVDDMYFLIHGWKRIDYTRSEWSHSHSVYLKCDSSEKFEEGQLIVAACVKIVGDRSFSVWERTEDEQES